MASGAPGLADLFDGTPELLALVVAHCTARAAFNLARLSSSVRAMVKVSRPGVALQSIKLARRVTEGDLFVVTTLALNNTNVADLAPLAPTSKIFL